MEEDVWQYSMQVVECRHGNTSLSPCPVDLHARGCALPDDSARTQVVHCMTGQSCNVSVVSPSVHCWHYIVIENRVEGDLDVTLKLNHEGEIFPL